MEEESTFLPIAMLYFVLFSLLSVQCEKPCSTIGQTRLSSSHEITMSYIRTIWYIHKKPSKCIGWEDIQGTNVQCDGEYTVTYKYKNFKQDMGSDDNEYIGRYSRKISKRLHKAYKELNELVFRSNFKIEDRRETL